MHRRERKTRRYVHRPIYEAKLVSTQISMMKKTSTVPPIEGVQRPGNTDIAVNAVQHLFSEGGLCAVCSDGC